MTVRLISLCMSCALKVSGVNKCKAFPDKIPEAILLWGGDHRTPKPGDSGIVFELDPVKQDLFLTWKESQ